MGTTLTGLTPATTYDALIKVGDNGPLSATAKYVGDGLGNDSVVALSTSSVGIGTTSPTQLLHVAGNVRITGALYDGNNAAGTSGQILSSTGTGTDWVSKSDLSLVDGSGTANYVSKWSDTDTLTNSIIYDNGSAVGVGTSSPARTLSISSAGTDGTQLQINGTVDSAGIKFVPSSGDNWEIQANTSSQWFVYNRTDNAYRLLIDNTGNVGIGTASPASRLVVVSDDPSQVSVEASTGNVNAQINLKPSGTGVAYIKNQANTDFAFGTNNTERMRITSAGNVGIGTSSPSQKLQVAGTGVTRITVENTDNQSTGAGLQMLVKNGGSTVGDGTIRTDNADNMQFFNIAGKIMELTSTGNLSLTTGNIALSAAGGIYFDSGASKYLDDYEVGTWTPVLRQNATNNTATYTLQTGTYTKIGNIITVFFDIATSSVTAGSGFLNIGGLPYTVSGSLAGFSYGGVRAATILDGSLTNAVAGVFAERSDSYLRIIATDTTDGQEFDPAAYAASGRITGTIQYTV